jgi:hypothetical protein
MAADWWSKPFSFESEGKPWAVLTDKVLLIGIQQENTLPKLGAEPEDVRQVQRMLSAQPKAPQVTSIQRLKSFLATDDYATILGVSVDTERLTKILGKLKQSSEVSLWDASSPHFVHKTLGLVAQDGKWKAFLMGVKHTWKDLPSYEFEPPVEVEPEFDVFTELMPAEASEPGSSS